MYLPDISGPEYVTPEKRHRRFTSRKVFNGPFWFYSRYALLVIWSGIKFLFTRNPQAAVRLQSLRVMRISEKQGAHLSFDGLDNFPPENGPYVFACNHQGSFEVNALPGLVSSRLPMTFVVKQSLLKVPFFGKVLRGLQAIPVERRHPGEDLRQVLEVGTDLLNSGVSIILFPEGTRQDAFSIRKFNSLAVKLAVKAGVSVVPVAVKSDFWGVGTAVRTFGSLEPSRPAHISFGSPLKPEGRGKAEHQAVLDYIRSHLKEWGSPVLDE